LEEQYVILDANDKETFEKAKKLFEEGWQKSDLAYNPFGTDDMRLLHLVKYTEEELEEKANEELLRRRPARVTVDENCLTVPILKYEDDKAGKENPYKILAAKGYREVHRTSTVAVMKLSDPRGVMLSDEDLLIIIDGLNWLPIEDKSDPRAGKGYEKAKIDALQYRLSEILKASEDAKKLEAEEEQTETETE